MKKLIKTISQLIEYVHDERQAKVLTDKIRGISQLVVREDLEVSFYRYALEDVICAYNGRQYNYTKDILGLIVDVEMINKGSTFWFYEIRCRVSILNKDNKDILSQFDQLTQEGEKDMSIATLVNKQCKYLLEHLSFHGLEYYHLRDREKHYHPHNFYDDEYKKREV